VEIYSVVELSAKLHIAEKTIRRYLKDGTLHGRKIARKWLIHEDALRELLMGGVKKVTTKQ
jgi:excisionase family DNA binding protein